MKTFTCECGAQVSKSADSCPKCGKRYGKLAETFKCRSCGTTLYKNDHFHVNDTYSHIISDGSSIVSSSNSLSQTKCTSCGEPYPYISKGSEKLRMFLHRGIMVFIFFTLVVALLYGIFGMNPWVLLYIVPCVWFGRRFGRKRIILNR